MNNAKYVLKFTEDIDVNTDPKQQKLKKAVTIILAVLIVGSFVLGENLFGELSFMPKILLVGLVFGVLFSGKKETRQFPVEIHFFDDRVEIHRLEVHYSSGAVKREFYVFRYEHNPVCVYSHTTRFTKIKGMAHGEWYLYNKNGVVEEKPARVRDMEGICYFRVSKASDIDLPEIIKAHSPIKVELD